MVGLKTGIFYTDVFLVLVLLIGAVWSIVKPEQRIWPPPTQRSWQYRLTWICFTLIFIMNAFLFIFDWDSWVFHGPGRFLVGIPIALLGTLLVTWGITTLGTKNTSGLADQFIKTGPYAFTRNPQYLGDNVLFLGLSIIANSELLWITHILLILVFLITPWTEEPWLEAEYGDEYKQYKQSTSRFL
jgi:protein-S-isoprenylcysteine O-methyltransferase Ste14